MAQFENIGKFLIITGVVIFLAGVLIHFGGKYFNLGRLPGDIFIKRENFSFSFPIVTSIVISIILTIILNIFFRK